MAQVVGRRRGIVAMAIDEPLPSPRPPFCRRRWKAGKPTGAREKTHRRARESSERARAKFPAAREAWPARAGTLAGDGTALPLQGARELGEEENA